MPPSTMLCTAPRSSAAPSTSRSGAHSGRFRSDSAMRVCTKPGQSTETPMGAPTAWRSLKSVSEMATTACLVAL